MRISFQKIDGHPTLGISFFWRLQIEGAYPRAIADIFIPELFYDFFYIQTGEISLVAAAGGELTSLPSQTLKTLHTHRLDLHLVPPLTLYGARLVLPFAEIYWGDQLPPNRFVAESWIDRPVDRLAQFAAQVVARVQDRWVTRPGTPLLSPTLEESKWLARYSSRHQRRLVRSRFGLGRKQMQAVQNLHAFLGQTCDFAARSPRIIDHIADERFYDQPHLNRAFKKLTGLSPLEFFEAGSLLQDNLMAASYKENSTPYDKIWT